MTRTDTHKKGMILALKKTLGIVQDACIVAKISRETHYRWYREDSKYANEVDDTANIALDFVESALFKKVKSGDTTAIIFYLKTKGKKRGYIERSEIVADLKGKQNVTVNIVRGNNLKS
jgi:hypothetical protein